MLESVLDFVPEWREVVVWTGMLTLTVAFTTPWAKYFAKGITGSIMLITRLGGNGNGDRLRIGSGKAGFDIEKSTLTEIITVIVIVCVALAVYSNTKHGFPNLIR